MTHAFDPAWRLSDEGGILVRYTTMLDGGGRVMCAPYADAIRLLFGRASRLHEYCAGPGFIGFHLLARGLCDHLVLSDVNPLAIAALRETVRANRLEDRVTIHASDCLDDIPSTERWDLSIANPPHYRVDTEEEYRENLRGHDPAWRIHRRYYEKIREHLHPWGSSLFLENYDGNEEADFVPMLAPGGMELAGSFMLHADETSTLGGLNRFYFFWTRPKHREVLWQDEHAAETLRISLADLAAGRPLPVLEATKKIRLELSNDTAEERAIGISGTDGRFLWPFPFPLVVPPGERRTTGIFYLDRGDYALVHIDRRFHDRETLWLRERPFVEEKLALLRVERRGTIGACRSISSSSGSASSRPKASAPRPSTSRAVPSSR